MTGQALAAIFLILAGTVLDVPIVIVLGFFTLVLETIREVWARYGLRDVTYVRRLATDRTTWGDEIPLTIEVWNRKRLPLAWLRAEDEATHGVVVRERALVEGVHGGVLRNVWTLAPFERVTRHFHVGAERRGVFVLGPVDARGRRPRRPPGGHRGAARRRRDSSFARGPSPRRTSSDRSGGAASSVSSAGLTEDPARFAGVRPYAPGDPLRRIHQRAERPARAARHEAVRAVARPGGADRTRRADRARTGLGAGVRRRRRSRGCTWSRHRSPGRWPRSTPCSGSPRRATRAPRRGSPISRSRRRAGQAERVLDLLARLSSHASAPFERLLVFVQRSGPPGDDRPRPHGPRPVAVRGPPPADRAVGLPGRRPGLRPAGDRRRRSRPGVRVRRAQCPARRTMADRRDAPRGPMSSPREPTAPADERPPAGRPAGPGHRRRGGLDLGRRGAGPGVHAASPDDEHRVADRVRRRRGGRRPASSARASVSAGPSSGSACAWPAARPAG